MLNICYFKTDSSSQTRPMAYRTPNGRCCQSPKGPNRLNHLVLVPWLRNIADWAITVKAKATRVGNRYRIVELFGHGMSAIWKVYILSLVGRQFADAV
jgi:hypothetical protein